MITRSQKGLGATLIRKAVLEPLKPGREETVH